MRSIGKPSASTTGHNAGIRQVKAKRVPFSAHAGAAFCALFDGPPWPPWTTCISYDESVLTEGSGMTSVYSLIVIYLRKARTPY